MTAREKFAINDTVETTLTARMTLYRGRTLRGVVRGFGEKPQVVCVQIEGRKVVTNFHLDFWQPVVKGEQGAA